MLVNLAPGSNREELEGSSAFSSLRLYAKENAQFAQLSGAHDATVFKCKQPVTLKQLIFMNYWFVILECVGV